MTALHTGEIQQFFHYAGETAGLLADDLQTAGGQFPIPQFVLQSLGPSLNGGQRGAQFVGYRGDKLILHPLGGGNLPRHKVDGIAQFADLIVITFFQTGIVFTHRNAAGGLVYRCHRGDNGIDKIPTRQGNKEDDQQHKTQQGQRQKQDLAVHLREGDDIPQTAGYHTAAVPHQQGQRHHRLTAIAATPPHPLSLGGRQRAGKIGGAGDRRHKTAGGQQHPTGGVQHLQFHLIFVVKIGDDLTADLFTKQGVRTPIDLHGALMEPGAALQSVLRALIVIKPQHHRKQQLQSHQKHHDEEKGVTQPTAGQSVLRSQTAEQLPQASLFYTFH